MKTDFKLAFRVDGNSEIGVGHFFRTLSLARASKRMAIEPTLFCLHTDEVLLKRAEVAGVNVVVLNSDCPDELVDKTTEMDWLSVDGYQYDLEFFQKLERTGVRTLAFDDCDNRILPVTAILNGNPYAENGFYKNSPARLKFLGTSFSPIDIDLADLASSGDVKPRSGNINILVTFGGSRHGIRASDVVFKALGSAPVNCSIVYVGPLTELNAGSFARLKDVTHFNFSDRMHTLMGDSDMAFSAGGSTMLELACLGVPAAIVCLVENQQLLSAECEKRGFAINLGDADKLKMQRISSVIDILMNPDVREEMSEAGKLVVDGYGCDRVLMKLFDFPIRLRRARWSDSETLHTWANDPDARSASLHSGVIPIEVHEKWLKSRLKNSGVKIYVAVDGQEKPCGVIRFESNSLTEAFRMSFTVAPSHRGRGIGSNLVRMGVHRLVFEHPDRTIVVRAEAKLNNVASQRIMESVGFYCEHSQSDKNYWRYLSQLN